MTTPLSQPDPANDAAAEPAPSGARLPLWRCKAPQDHEAELVARGIIPDRIEEELRLVDANHPVHDQFRKVLKEILAPYVPASELARLDTVTLRLADMKGGFGFCIPKSPVPVVGLDRSALDPSFAKSPKTIDALIGLLVHEFAHVLFEAEYEVCHGKQEEAAADIVAVRRLHEWGLDPRAYLDLMRGYTIRTRQSPGGEEDTCRS